MKKHSHLSGLGGMQIKDIVKNKVMMGGGRRKRSSSRRRHDHHRDEEGFSSSDGDFYDAEAGKSRRHHHHKKDRRKSKERQHQSRALAFAHHELVPARDFTLQLNSPSHRVPSLFMLPPGSKLSPRSDVWLLLSLSSIATLSSIALSSTPDARSTPEKTSLILSSVLFTISTVIGAGYRYTPIRDSLTGTSEIFCLKSTKETAIAAVCLCLVVVATAIVMDPSLYIAIGGNGIWNANIFFAGWSALYTCFYLVADLITTNDPSGLVENQSATPKGLSYFDSVAKIWWMLLGSNVALVGVLFEFSNTVCASSLSTSPVCERGFVAALLSIFSLLLNLAALALYRMALLGEMRRSRLECFNGAERAYKMSRRIGSVLSFLVFALQTTAVAIVSAPSGPGLEGGSIFLIAWLSFGLSLIILKSYVESFCLPFAPQLAKKPMVQPKFFDESFRTFGTIGTSPTDIDDSDKLTDEEDKVQPETIARQHYYIEHQRPAVNPPPLPAAAAVVRQEIIQHVPSKNSSTRSQSLEKPEPLMHFEQSFITKPTSSKTGSTRVSEEPAGVKASFTSSTQPMVFTRSQCDVSTLGNGTQEPFGLKSGSSYCGGPNRSNQGPPQRQRQPTPEDIDEDSLPFMYPISVGTRSECDDEQKPEVNQAVKVLQRRSSYCSAPSLPAVKEGSIESSSRDNTKESGSQKQQRRRNVPTKKSSKVSKTKATKHKFERRGSDGSSSLSDPRTIVDIEFKLPQSHNTSSTVSTSEEFSIVCDNKSIVTEITTEGFDVGHPAPMSRQPPMLPHKNPLYNGSDGSASSGMPTPRLNAFNSSVDDLVASALSYARKSRHNPNASARTLSTMSPTPSSSSSYLKAEYLPKQSRPPRSTPTSHQMKKGSTRGNTPKQSSAIAKAKRRGSLQSMYSTSNSGDAPVDAGMNFAC